jgi:Mn2+/Fe2+ NRAMP family transporter
MWERSLLGVDVPPTLPDKTHKLRWLRDLGPGLITGASDDDPSGIATYSQAGAQLGFALSWVMVVTYPLMAAIQEISAYCRRSYVCCA